MPKSVNKNSYLLLKETTKFKREQRDQRENFGGFSISAAVRPSNCGNCNSNYNNYLRRNSTYLMGI